MGWERIAASRRSLAALTRSSPVAVAPSDGPGLSLATTDHEEDRASARSPPENWSPPTHARNLRAP
jgi:hypothetical protein